MPSPSLAPFARIRLEFIHRFTNPPERMVGVARRPQKLPDYFTSEEAEALVAAAPTFPTRMAYRIMLRTELRVSEALSLRRSDLRLNQDPPVISIRPDDQGNKGREVPIPGTLPWRPWPVWTAPDGILKRNSRRKRATWAWTNTRLGVGLAGIVT